VAELSPAAQAVLASYHKEAIDYIESWGSFSHKRGMAAALRAAAEQVLPKIPTSSYLEDYEFGVWDAREDARNELLAIAAELDSTNNTREGGFDG
jgi:hypothetical protein